MTDERIIAYLLEELPEDELERFEDECFALEGWPAELNLVEEELIDAYVRRELTQQQRQSFERNYLTTQARRERVVMAAALLRHTDQYNANSQAVAAASAPAAHAQTGPTWAERFNAFWASRNWALSAATLIVVATVMAGALWLLFRREPAQGTFATLTLSMSVNNNRAEGAQPGKVTLPLTADALKISLMLPEGAKQAEGYRVELENADGATKPLEVTGRDAQSISVLIPAAQLSRGQYALKLFIKKPDGTEQRIPGNYFFNVE